MLRFKKVYVTLAILLSLIFIIVFLSKTSEVTVKDLLDTNSNITSANFDIKVKIDGKMDLTSMVAPLYANADINVSAEKSKGACITGKYDGELFGTTFNNKHLRSYVLKDGTTYYYDTKAEKWVLKTLDTNNFDKQEFIKSLKMLKSTEKYYKLKGVLKPKKPDGLVADVTLFFDKDSKLIKQIKVSCLNSDFLRVFDVKDIKDKDMTFKAFDIDISIKELNKYKFNIPNFVVKEINS